MKLYFFRTMKKQNAAVWSCYVEMHILACSCPLIEKWKACANGGALACCGCCLTSNEGGVEVWKTRKRKRYRVSRAVMSQTVAESHSTGTGDALTVGNPNRSQAIPTPSSQYNHSTRLSLTQPKPKPSPYHHPAEPHDRHGHPRFQAYW